MLKDKKGMTLVETIVTVAVFSIAALMLATGFSTVIRYMGEASAIKNTGNEVYAMIESEANESVTSESVAIKITLDNGTEIKDTISKKVAEKGIDEDSGSYKIRFVKLSKKESYVDTTKTFYEQVKSAMEYCLANPKTWKDKYNESLNQLKEIDSEKFSSYSLVTSDYLNNDQFIKYFRITGVGNEIFPVLNEKIIEKCNEIFDKTKGLLSNVQTTNVRIGNKKMYMKCIYVPDTSHPMVFLVADEYPYAEKVNQWRTRLVYYPEEECWYYKIHTSTNVDYNTDTNHFYAVSSFTTYSQWQNLLVDFKDATKWRKIELD